MKKWWWITILILPHLCGSTPSLADGKKPDTNRFATDTLLVETTSGLGSAVAVKTFRLKADGDSDAIDQSVIVTAAHVVGNAKAVTVHLGNQEFPAAVTAVDRPHDIALLIADVKLPCADVAKPYPLRLLDDVYVAGCPDGYAVPWVQPGHIGCMDVTVTDDSHVVHAHRIGIVCAAQPGMSGGAVYNHDGRLIGIFTLQVGNDSLGAFVPISDFYGLLPK